MAFYAQDPSVILVGFLMGLVLLIAINFVLVRQGYFKYEDLTYILNAFIVLTGVVVMTVAGYLSLMFASPLSPYFDVVTHSLIAAAAGLFALDAFFTWRKNS